MRQRFREPPRHELPVVAALLREWVEAAPRQQEAHLALGVLHCRAESYKDAVACFREAASLDPQWAGSPVRMAETSAGKGLTEIAEAILQSVLKVHPGDFAALQALTRLLRDRGRVDEALTLAQTLAPDQRQTPAFFTLLGDLLRELPGQETRGLDRYQQALLLEPDHADARYGFALLLQRLGREEHARQHWARFLEVEPEGERRTRVERGLVALREHPLTTGYALDHLPDWAPDGRRIVFCRGRESSLWVLEVGQPGSERPLTRRGSGDTEPDWAPDSESVVFVRVKGTAPGLYVLPVDPGNAARLLLPGTGLHNPRWSPDGSQIVFESEERGLCLITPSDGRVLPLSVRVDGVDRLATPDWLPSGNVVVAAVRRTAEGDGAELASLDPTTKDYVELTRDGAPKSNPTPSPNGNLIAYSGPLPKRNTVGLWAIDAHGLGQPLLLARTTHVWDRTPRVRPAWAPDGGRLCFGRDRNLWIIQLGGLGRDRKTKE